MAEHHTKARDVDDPLFSVVIPTYNRADLVVRAIDSVLCQSFAAFEVLVLDDGSDDNTEEVVREIPDERIGYEKLQRSGAARARNIGAKKASGEMLIFLDSDDFALEGWLQSIADSYDNTTALVSVDCWSERGNERSRLGPVDIGYEGSGMRGRLLSGSYAIKRQLFLDIGGFAEDLPSAHHTDLSFRLFDHLAEEPMRTVHLDVPLVVHSRDMPHSIRRNDRNVLDGTEYIINNHLAKLARDPKRLANYHSIAGVAAIKLGERRRARSHLYRSIKAHPTSLKRWGRLIVAALPWSSLLWEAERMPRNDAKSP